MASSLAVGRDGDGVDEFGVGLDRGGLGRGGWQDGRQRGREEDELEAGHGGNSWEGHGGHCA